MKLTILNFFVISASASMSSDADQHGKDKKYIRRDLKGHHHEQHDKKVNKKKMEKEKSSKAKKMHGESFSTTPAEPSMRTKTDVTAELSSMSMSMQSVSLAPTSLEPTSLAPTTMSPATTLPTFSPTLAPSVEVDFAQAANVNPACPPAYDITKTDYVSGELVTLTDNIFECNSLYVKYCNIGEWDDALLAQDANAAEYWSDAWVHISPCSVSAAVPEPTALPTFSPTLVPSTIDASVQAFADAIPACPPAYDVTNVDYVGGDIVTVNKNIFRCHSLYVMYCNIGEWDEALLTQDANAEEMWDDSWVYVGPCV